MDYFGTEALNRLTQEVQPQGEAVSHAYDAVGHRTALATAAGAAYYSYDAVGRMAVADGTALGVGATYYSYDPGSRLTQKVLGNGCYSYYTYDAAGRLTIIDHRLPAGGSLAYFGYSYDAASRIISVVRDAGMSIYYNYDDADRLTGESWYNSAGSNIYAFTWNYDAVGNRTYQMYNGAQTYYQYNAANALANYHLLPDNTWTYWSYDARGNCTQINAPNGGTYFSYNGLNLMTSVLFRNGVANYFFYDAQQRRYAIRESTGTTYFAYDADGLCALLERDSSGNIMAEYARGYAPIAGIGDRAAGKLITAQGTYYQYDASGLTGNLTRITNALGAVVGSFEYNAWGMKLTNIQPPEGTRYGMSAPAWIEPKDDPDNFHVWTPTRTFHRGIGRFIQRDNLRTTGKYAAFHNSPLRNVDTTGLIESTVTKASDEVAAMLENLWNLKAIVNQVQNYQGTDEERRNWFLEQYQYLGIENAEQLWTHLMALKELFGSVSDLGDKLSKLIIVLAGNPTEAEKKQIFKEISKDAFSKILSAAGVSGFATKLILEAGNLGSSFGTWMPEKFAAIKHSKDCDCCIATAEKHEPGEEWSIPWPYGNPQCYKDTQRAVYAAVTKPATSSGDGFFGMVYDVVTKSATRFYQKCRSYD